MAAFPWTTACSPYTMTLPGAEVIKAGFIGDEGFRVDLGLCGDSVPLAIFFERSGISDVEGILCLKGIEVKGHFSSRVICSKND